MTGKPISHFENVECLHNGGAAGVNQVCDTQPDRLALIKVSTTVTTTRQRAGTRRLRELLRRDGYRVSGSERKFSKEMLRFYIRTATALYCFDETQGE